MIWNRKTKTHFSIYIQSTHFCTLSHTAVFNKRGEYIENIFICTFAAFRNVFRTFMPQIWSQKLFKVPSESHQSCQVVRCTKKTHTRYFYTLQTDILDNQFVCHNAISYFSFRSCDVGCTIKCSSDIFCNSSSSYFASRTLHFTFYHFLNNFYNSLCQEIKVFAFS